MTASSVGCLLTSEIMRTRQTRIRIMTRIHSLTNRPVCGEQGMPTSYQRSFTMAVCRSPTFRKPIPAPPSLEPNRCLMCSGRLLMRITRELAWRMKPTTPYQTPKGGRPHSGNPHNICLLPGQKALYEHRHGHERPRPVVCLTDHACVGQGFRGVIYAGEKALRRDSNVIFH